MDLGTVSWIVFGWVTVALVMSFALGKFLRKANEAPDNDHFAVTAIKHNVVTYMRGRKPAIVRGNTMVPLVNEMGKRATG